MKNKLSEFKHFDLSILPTPFYLLKNISEDLNAIIFCKRDDMTGFAFGGNKTRKLDYLLYDAKEKKCDTLIGIGAVQSNFCRLTAAMGKRMRFYVHLILGGSKQTIPTANHFLGKFFDAKTYYVDNYDWDKWVLKAKEVEHKLIDEGHIPYWMPIGGSSTVGAMGYVNAFAEMHEDLVKNKIEYIFHASASAGTQAGLICGKKLFGWDGKIVGIGVAKSKEVLSKEVYSLANETAKLLNINISSDDVIADNNYMGEGYAAITEDSENAVKYFAHKEGIMLDYVYSGKAAAGMLDYIERKLIPPDTNILFLHTGGNVALFK